MVTEGLTVDATESMTAQRVFDGEFAGGGDDRQSMSKPPSDVPSKAPSLPNKAYFPKIRLISGK